MTIELHHSLGKLADPTSCTEPIDLKGFPADRLTSMLESMLTIRCAEELIGEMVTAGKVRCPCHLAIGQEAVPVGVAASLRATDAAFGTHRSHAHYLAQGGSLGGLLAEVLGKDTGCSKGMGGSQHLFAGAKGFLGSVPLVAATIPLAVGAALAAKMKGEGNIGIAYFGDGATEEGAFHESLNYAAAFQLPALFVCENNLFSSHLHIRLRQPADAVSRFSTAHLIPTELVDGNDVVAVTQAADRLIARARRGEGPGFLEALTYRWRGHVGAREDIDVGVKRKEDLTQWKKRDPIHRLFVAMRTAGMLTDAELEKMESKIRSTIEDEWKRAEEAPYPEKQALLDLVYWKET